MKQEDKEYISQYIEVDEDVERCIKVHRQYYKNVGKVCAWYKNKEDFYSDWCGIGYTRLQADKLFRGCKGEFTTLPDGKGIIRFEI